MEHGIQNGSDQILQIFHYKGEQKNLKIKKNEEYGNSVFPRLEKSKDIQLLNKHDK